MSYSVVQAFKTPGLNLRERAVFAYLVARANGLRACWPSVEDMQQDLAIKTRHGVCDATRRLAELKLIEVKRQLRGRNQYVILDPDGRIYAPPQDVQETAHPAPDAPIEDVQKTAHPSSGDVQKTAHRILPEDVQISAHRSTQNASNNVQKTAHLNVPRFKKETLIPAENPKSPGRSPIRESVARRATRPKGSPIPNDWQPTAASVALGVTLGFSDQRIRIEAEELRAWAIRSNTSVPDWDHRFESWLRQEFKRADARSAPSMRAVRPAVPSKGQSTWDGVCEAVEYFRRRDFAA